MKKLLLASIIASTLTGAIFASDIDYDKTQDTRGKHCQKESYGHNAIFKQLKELNLTSSQKEDIKAVQAKYHKSIEKVITDNKYDALSIDKNGNFNKQDYVAKAEAKSKAIIDLKSQMIEEIIGKLSSEQKSKLGAKLN